ncbi:hypothetical protein AS189_08390 [Arthrobacter alpinus]|uniref:Histidine kinase/HSP90-like ATPase domain-containing protein n=1 Tax=Arthrobacter alpinus TaxID=656366 RepID=A0A0S2LY74_9MICC|nr:ATP-binding protein [Arthrobacter alpinus]ALO66505.1 hypothetical protein AS189_08390 [Arthrobacter alpinus]
MRAQLQDTSLLPNTVEMTEVVLARSIGVFSLLLVALALPDLLQNTGGQPRPGYITFVVMVPVLIIAAMLPVKHAVIRRFFAGSAAWLILLGFLLWHLGLIGNSLHADARPWSWGIAGAGVGLAAVARNTSMASVYGALFTILVLVIPGLPAGSAREWQDSWQDALLTFAMTAAIIAPIWALRQAVQESECAAVTAVEKFSDAAKSQAITVERMRLDALTHDIVLSTLIVASQAVNQDVVEASRRAATAALAQLDDVRNDAGPSQGEQVAVGEWLGRLGAAVSMYGITVDVPAPGTPARQRIPLLVGRAIVQATTEAVRNSLEHANGAQTAVNVSFPHEGQTGQEVADSVRVTISDNGPGFDLETIPLERMGIRVSIVERMQDVQGSATVISSSTAGTLVLLEWDGGIHGTASN